VLKIFTRNFWAKEQLPKRQEDVPKYPPHIHGVHVASVKHLLEDQHDLIQKLRNSCSVRPEIWESLYYPAIENYASFVHLLPASERNHHRLIGGLLRHGLEVAAWSLQLADRHMFALDVQASKRKDVEQTWHFGAFIGGLCHDLGKPVSDMLITSPDGEKEWNPFLSNITTWAKDNDIQRYFIRWRKDNRNKRHECLAPLVIDRVLTPEARAYLSSTGPELMKQLMLALEGEGYGILQEVVREADVMSTTKDKENMSIIEEDGTGVPVGRVLLTAMHTLANSDWKINTPGSQLWYMNNELYVIWPGSSGSLATYIRANGSEGIPSNPESIADILIEHTVVEPNDNQRYWWISPAPLAERNNGIKLSALRIKEPSLLLDVIPESVDGQIVLHKSVEKAGAEKVEDQSAPIISNTDAPASSNDEHADNDDDDQTMIAAAQIASMGQEVISNENTQQTMSDAAETLEDKIRRENKGQARGVAPPPEIIMPELQEDYPPIPQSNITQIKQVAKDVKDKRTPNRPSDYYLKRLGPTCESLRFIAEDLKTGDKKWGVNACMYKGMVALKYPATFDGYGIEPKKALAQLGKHELIYVDKYAPNKKIIEVPSMGIVHEKAVILGEELTKEFLLLSGVPASDEKEVLDDTEKKVSRKERKPEKPTAKKKPSQANNEKHEVVKSPKKKAAPKKIAAPSVEVKKTEIPVKPSDQDVQKSVEKKTLHHALKKVLSLVKEDDYKEHKDENWVSVKVLVALARANKIKGNMHGLVEGSFLEKDVLDNDLYVKVEKDV